MFEIAQNVCFSFSKLGQSPWEENLFEFLFFLSKNLNVVKFFNFNDKASEEKQYIFLDTSFLDRLSAK